MSNVFGLAITTKDLEDMPKYEGKSITRFDRAHEAWIAKYDVNQQHTQAYQFCKALKEDYGNGVSTLGLIYNATGDTVKFHDSKDWDGHLYSAAYPTELANGQWGAFLHVHPTAVMAGSNAGFAYRGQNNSNEYCDWVCSWVNPWWPGYDCKTITEIYKAGGEENDLWNGMIDRTRDANPSSPNYYTKYGCYSEVTIGNATTSNFTAIFCLEGANSLE